MAQHHPYTYCMIHHPWTTDFPSIMGRTTFSSPMGHGSYRVLYGDVWTMTHGEKVAEGAPFWHEHYRQLIRMGWYPASFNHPRTMFSFDLLGTYHKVTLQGKLNLYDFYLAIMHKSDNQGRTKPVVRNLQ